MNKIIITSLFFVLLFSGCTHKTEKVSFSAFNDEVYVWENYNFTTNTVEVK